MNASIKMPGIAAPLPLRLPLLRRRGLEPFAAVRPFRETAPACVEAPDGRRRHSHVGARSLFSMEPDNRLRLRVGREAIPIHDEGALMTRSRAIRWAPAALVTMAVMLGGCSAESADTGSQAAGRPDSSTPPQADEPETSDGGFDPFDPDEPTLPGGVQGAVAGRQRLRPGGGRSARGAGLGVAAVPVRPPRLLRRVRRGVPEPGPTGRRGLHRLARPRRTSARRCRSTPAGTTTPGSWAPRSTTWHQP